MSMDMDKLYALGLHESMEVNTGPCTYWITRVPGGWLYDTYRLDCNAMTSTFVPYISALDSRL